MSTPRLLVVDDEPFNLEIIAECFESLGYQLDTAAHGEEAWSCLNGPERYDVIILDRMMPVLDGMALLRRVKGDSRFAHVPLIMQTAAGDPEQVREGLAAGAHYCLTKPYERESLLSIVRGALDDVGFRRQLQLRPSCHGDALKLLESAEFSFRTLAEAETLAAFIADRLPQPESAVLGISELLINAVEHGNLGIGYAEKGQLKREGRWLEEIERRLALPENRNKRVRVWVVRNTATTNIRVADDGCGFDWQKYLDFDPERACDPNGRGITLARLASFASLSYEGAGNVVVAVLKHSG